MKNYIKSRINDTKFVVISCFVLVLCIISAYMQFTSYINLDTANALYESKLLFAGGKYFHNFFETSPPMFLYVYFPLVELFKYFSSINFVTGVFTYFLLLSLISIGICYTLAKKILYGEKTKLIVLISSIAFVFIILGVNYFGQREQMSLILVTPYFLLLASRLEKKETKIYLKIIVGILAGIGFSTKPHFCIPFFLTELFFILKHKRFSAVFRIESITIFFIFVVYLISTYLLYPAYFKVIIPLSIKFYYFGINADPFWKDFFTIKMGYCYITILLYLILHKINLKFSSIITPIFVGMIGYALSYLSEVVPWDYHLFPAFCFAIILNIFLLQILITQKYSSRFHFIILIFFSVFVYLYNTLYIGMHIIFSILMIVFCLSFYLKKYFFENFLQKISVISLAALIFSYPIYVTYAIYASQKHTKIMMNPIIQFLHQNAYGKKVYFFSSILSSEYPTVDYAGAIHVSRFPYLLWIPAYIKALSENQHGKHTAEIYGMNIFFTNLLAKDIALKKPEFILVDSSKYIATPTFDTKDFSYLNLFEKIPGFQKVWKHYHYFTTIEYKSYYIYKVYKINEKEITSEK